MTLEISHFRNMISITLAFNRTKIKRVKLILKIQAIFKQKK